MSKAAVADLAKTIYDKVLSINIRKEVLDKKTHVFIINEASIKDGFGNFLGLTNANEINAAVKILTAEFKRIAKEIVPYGIDPTTFVGYDPSKHKLQHIELGNTLLIISTSEKSAYKNLSELFLYKVRNKLGDRFKEKKFDFLFTNEDGTTKTVSATNILGTETIQVSPTATNQKRFIDIGHTAAFGKEERNTPLGYKLGEAKKLADASTEIGAAELSVTIQGLIEKLSGVHGEFTLETRKELGPLGILAKNKNVIGIADFIITLPQHYIVNQKLINYIEDKISKEITDVILKLKGSPSLAEMLMSSLLEAFQTGKVTNKNSRAKSSKEFDILGNKPIGHTFKKQPPLRDVKGKFFNILRLQNLINAQLHDRLKKNMGSGYSSDRLNYRTGRFAKSAKVTAITPADQLLNTYFTYMKYPYATFAPGGKQYRGGGRDPEVLIDMTIREIAIGLVSKQFKVIPKVVQ